MRIFQKIIQAKNQIFNLGIYFLAAMIPMALSLVSNPFIALNMSPVDYAITGYYQAFTVLFGPLVNFYLLHYYTKRYYELDEGERQELKATLFRTLIFFSLLLGVVALIILAVYTFIFNDKSEIPFLPYAVICVFSLPITGIYTLSLTEYRMQRSSKKFFNLSVSNGALSISVLLLFVVAFKWGAIGKMMATFVASAIIFIYVLVKNKNVWKYKFQYGVLKEALMFCWPLVIASMLTFFCSGYDKIILERLGDIETLGIYSVGVTIAGYLHVFSNSINDTFQPDIFESIVKRNFRRCLKYIITKISIMSFCVACFSLLAPYIIDILTYGRYVLSTPFAIIVSISSITSMLYYSMSQVTVALGFTSITLLNKIFGSVLSVLSFNILIQHFGAVGAAWGIVVSYVYFFLGNVILVLIKYKKQHKSI